MSFLHDVFFHNTRFEVSETTLAKLYPFAEYNRAIKSIQEVVIPKIDESPNTNTLDFLEFDTPTSNIAPTNISTPHQPTIAQQSKPIMTAGKQPLNDKSQNGRPVNDRSQTERPLNERPTLFWCVFLAHYGYSEFLRVGKRFQNRELEEKQQIMETLSKNPKQMKDGNMKLTNDSIQEILSGLMVSTNDSFSALVAYSKYYNKTIYVVFSCSFLVFSNTKEPTEAKIEDTCVLYQTRKHPKYGGSYRLEEEPTLEKLKNIRETKIEMEHYAKPFRGISAYKLGDLETMAQKIGVLDAKGKADLYAKIVEKCCQGIQTI